MNAILKASSNRSTAKHFITLFIVFLVSLCSVTAQDINWQNCVSNEDVRDIEVDGENTWIATTGGLILLDANLEEVERFTSLKSNLPCNWIDEIEVDINGVVWIRHCYGISAFDGVDFVNYDIQNCRITLDQNKNIFIAISNGFYTWNGLDFDFEELPLLNEGLSLGSVYVEPSGVIWFTRATFGLFEFYKYEDGILTPFTTANSGLPLDFQQYIQFVPRSSGGVSILLANQLFSYQEGIWILETTLENRAKNLVVNDDGSFYYLSSRTVDDVSNTYLVNMSANFELVSEKNIDLYDYAGSVLSASEESILIGYTHIGLYEILDTEINKIALTKTELTSNRISEMNVVNDEIVFTVGSVSPYYYRGHSVISYAETEWNNRNNDYPYQSSDDFTFPWMFEQGIGDTTYMIHNKISYYQTGDGNWTPAENPDLLDDVNESYTSVFIDKDDRKWLFDLWTSNIFYHSPSGWKVFAKDEHKGVSGIHFSKFNHPFTGEFWFSSYNGVSVYDYTFDTWRELEYEDFGLDCSSATFLVSKDDEIYGICRNQFFKLNGIQAEILEVVDSIGSTGYFTEIYEDREGKIWLSSNDMVSIYDDGEWSYLTPANSSIVNGLVRDIYQDNEGNYWFVSSTGGIAIYNENGLADHFFDDFHTSIDNVEDSRLVSVYPNPTTGLLSTQALIKNLNTSNLYDITVLNQSGQQVMLFRNVKDDSIDISNLSPGIYLLEIQASDGFQVAKVIKQ